MVDIILKIAMSLILALFGYLLFENIKVLKDLRDTVDRLMLKFATHEEANKATYNDVKELKNRVSDVEDVQVELKLRINTAETLLKIKDGANN